MENLLRMNRHEKIVFRTTILFLKHGVSLTRKKLMNWEKKNGKEKRSICLKTIILINIEQKILEMLG